MKTYQLLILAVGLLVAGGESRAAAQAQPPMSSFFVERFMAGTLNVHLQDVDGKFLVEAAAIHVGGNEGNASANRHYVTSVRSDYRATDWTYEITFNAPSFAFDDILFIGVGEGVPDVGYFNEPRNSLNFRIHQGYSAFGTGWRVDVAAHGNDYGASTFTYLQSIGQLSQGPWGGSITARITKVGNQITFEILDAVPAISLTIPDIASAAPFLNPLNSHIFFGNASNQYSFSDLRVLPESVDQRD